MLGPREQAGLIATAWWWAKRSGAQYILTSCHPHHSEYYCRRYGLRVLVRRLRYPKLLDAPLEILGAPMEEMLDHPRGGGLLKKHQPPDDLLDSRLCAEVTL